MALTIKKAAELGFRLVHVSEESVEDLGNGIKRFKEGIARFEKTTPSGVINFAGPSVEAALAALEASLSQNPGIDGSDQSRDNLKGRPSRDPSPDAVATAIEGRVDVDENGAQKPEEGEEPEPEADGSVEA